MLPSKSRLLSVVGGLAISLLTTGPAFANNSLSFSSLPGNNTSFGDANGYLTNWLNLQATYPSGAAGYGDAPINIWDWPVQGNVDNHELIPGGSSGSIAYHYQVNFDVNPGDTGNWDIRVAPDFGFGGGVFLDGVPVAYNPNDMWWNLDWNNTSQIFTFSSTLSAGSHTMDVYGQEFCCDGPTGAEYRIHNGSYQPFMTTPEPSSVALLLTLGATTTGLLLRRRRKSAS